MTVALITGASGFLGAHVVAGALARGFTVRAGVRASSDRSRLDRLAPGATVTRFDLDASSAEMTDALEGVDAVIHCAAYGVDYRQSDFAKALALNVAGSMRLAVSTAARGCRLVHVGTSYEYGTEDGVLAESRRLAPTGIYGVTKAAASLAMQDFSQRTKSPIAVVRPFSMYGPLEGSHKFVPLVMEASRTGRPVELSPGNQERDYLYVGDVVDACLTLATSDIFPSGEIFNVCSGNSVTLRALATAAVEAAGGDISVLRWGAKPYRPAESMRVVGDASKLTSAIGWRATTLLAEGMKHTVTADISTSDRESNE